MSFLRRHGNALGFWGVLVVVALALVLATALFRSALRRPGPRAAQSAGPVR